MTTTLTVTTDEQLADANLRMRLLKWRMNDARARGYLSLHKRLVDQHAQACDEVQGLRARIQWLNCVCGHPRLAHFGGAKAWGRCCTTDCECWQYVAGECS